LWSEVSDDLRTLTCSCLRCNSWGALRVPAAARRGWRYNNIARTRAKMFENLTDGCQPNIQDLEGREKRSRGAPGCGVREIREALLTETSRRLADEWLANIPRESMDQVMPPTLRTSRWFNDRPRELTTFWDRHADAVVCIAPSFAMDDGGLKGRARRQPWQTCEMDFATGIRNDRCFHRRIPASGGSNSTRWKSIAFVWPATGTDKPLEIVRRCDQGSKTFPHATW